MSAEVQKEQSALEKRKDLTASEKQRLEKLQQVTKQLESEKVTYPKPMLVNQVGYLFNIVRRADQLPGKDVFDRLEELQAEKQKLEQMMD
jgi:hypothetical protein